MLDFSRGKIISPLGLIASILTISSLMLVGCDLNFSYFDENGEEKTGTVTIGSDSQSTAPMEEPLPVLDDEAVDGALDGSDGSDGGALDGTDIVDEAPFEEGLNDESPEDEMCQLVYEDCMDTETPEEECEKQAEECKAEFGENDESQPLTGPEAEDCEDSPHEVEDPCLQAYDQCIEADNTDEVCENTLAECDESGNADPEATVVPEDDEPESEKEDDSDVPTPVEIEEEA